LRTCRICRDKFEPVRSMQPTCGKFECNYEFATRAAAKSAAKRKAADRKETKEKKDAIKTRSDWLKEAQTEFNKFIRARDHALPCISCGRHVTGDYHAGHYRSVAAAPQLRFNEDNVHKQCGFNCNVNKSGNAIEYRIALVKKIGLARVEALENDNSVAKWSIEEIKEIKATYKRKLKELKA
jgi:hypothetical protein